EGQDMDESHYQFGIEMEPLDGVVLKGSVDKDLTFKTGLSISFLNTSVGYTASLDTMNGLRENGVQLVSSLDRNRTVLGKRGEIAEVRIAGRIEDTPPGFSLLGGRAKPLSGILEQLRKAREDRTVSAVLLNIRSFSAGTGTTYEMRRAIEDLKGAGKRVVAYLEEGGMDLTMYLASAAERVVVCPSSEIIVKGPYAQVMMLKGFLDKIGVEADLVRRGKYKSAVEPFTREELSEEAREEYQDLIDGMYEETTAKIFSARNISTNKTREILEQGAMRPEQAKSLGLVDHVGYYDDAKLAAAELLGRRADDPDRVRTADMRKRMYRRYCWTEPPTVAVVLASGAIVTGPSRSDFLYGSQYMGSETVVNQLRRLRAERSVRAVVLRVDSPGGDGLASDLIWREVDKMRKSGKPIVVSMSDVAASGGYYISCSASRIFADPTTITGSIGVLGGKAVLAGAYGKLGINPEIIKSTEHSDVFSPARKFTGEERKRFQEQIDYFYDDFIIKVSEGRGLEREKVYEIAQGRVYTGVEAMALGLVDEIGTLQDAIDAAAEMANIEEEPKAVYVNQKRGFLQRISGCTNCHGLLGAIDNN
ncbi:MAG: signal peptide peptidase SppA, partial [bacterium]